MSSEPRAWAGTTQTLLVWILAIPIGGALYTSLVWMHAERPENSVVIDRAMFVADDGLLVPVDVTGADRVALPDDWRKRNTHAATGWYLADIDLEVAPNRLWGIYVPGVEMAPAVFVNGVTVGSAGRFEDPLPRYWNRPIYYSIPSGILVPGENQIAVRIHANDVWGRLTEIYLGPEQSLRPYYEFRYGLRVTFVYVTALASFVVALFVIALSFVRKDPVFWWFGAFASAWGLHNVAMLTVDLPVLNKWWDLFVYGVLGYLMLTGSTFTLRFLNVRYPVFERMLIGTGIAGPVILAGFAAFDHIVFNAIGSQVWIVLLIAMTAFPFVLLIRYTLRADRIQHLALSVCYTLIIPLVLHDWSVTAGFGYRHDGFLLQYAATPVLATFGIIILSRFVEALRQTDELNLDLAERVNQKALEIERSYARNRELEAAQILADERHRLMRDMHDGVGGQLIATLARLDRQDARDSRIGIDLELALSDLRLMIDSMESVDNDIPTALGLLRNRIQPQLDDARLKLEWQVKDLPTVELGPERTLHFLRIMQEAITNVIKHARASTISVVTTPSQPIDGVVCATIEVIDNGVGMRDDAEATGRGLVNMHYRAQSAGLTLHLATSGSGTSVCIGFPLHEVTGTTV